MFTDTHCHISTEDYSNIELIIENAKKNGITKMINNGCNLKSNIEVLKLAKMHKNLYPAIGFHPDSAPKYKKEDISFLENHIDEVVAIGEIGLDYHYDKSERDKQIELFESQLNVAQKYHKSVIIHSRDATKDTIEILKKYPNIKGSIHCFSGSLETANIYIEMGFKIGLGGVTTFKNSKIKDIIKDIPLSSIILETDSPYLSPEPVRGTKNEPQNILHIAKYIAEIKGITLEELSITTQKNVSELFDI